MMVRYYDITFFGHWWQNHIFFFLIHVTYLTTEMKRGTNKETKGYQSFPVDLRTGVRKKIIYKYKVHSFEFVNKVALCDHQT